MTANVSEVKAFRSYDGEVFDTFLKAHHHNIEIFVAKLLDLDDGYEYSQETIVKHIASMLKSHGQARNAIEQLYKELF